MVDLKNHNVFQGILLLGAGILLLLYTLNLITAGINLILVIAALGLIVYGTIISGLDHAIKTIVNSIIGRK